MFFATATASQAVAKPGLLAFLVVAGLGVATFFLLRSMTKQIRKIDFDEEPEREPESPTEQSPGGESIRESASGEWPGGGPHERSVDSADSHDR